MGGNSDKTSGGTRNYASQPGTLRNRKAEYRRFMGSGEYDKNKSYFHKSGGFVVVHDEHYLKRGELNAGKKLARKGYKVYLDSERSTITGGATRDGSIYHSPMDIKAIGKAGKWSIKREMEKAAKQGAETVVLMQRTRCMTRAYVDDQIQKFRDNGTQMSRAKIKWVIVVGMSGNVHRHKV